MYLIIFVVYIATLGCTFANTDIEKSLQESTRIDDTDNIMKWSLSIVFTCDLKSKKSRKAIESFQSSNLNITDSLFGYDDFFSHVETYEDIMKVILKEKTFQESLEFMYKNKKFLHNEYPINNSFLYEIMGADRDKDEVRIDPAAFHYRDQTRLANSLVPLYVFSTILGLLAYISKVRNVRKLRFLSFDIQLSDLSRILFKFLILQFIYNITYLIYLILFINFKFFRRSNLLHLIIIGFRSFVKVLSFHIGSTIFIQGYCIFDFSDLLLVNPTSFLLTVAYTLTDVGVEFYRNFYDWDRQMRHMHGITHTDDEILIIVTSVFKMILIAFIVLKFIQTCKLNKNSDNLHRFKKSFVIISAVYFLMPLIRIPADFDFYSLVSFYDDSLTFWHSESIAVPELWGIGVTVYLTCLWAERFETNSGGSPIQF